MIRDSRFFSVRSVLFLGLCLLLTNAEGAAAAPSNLIKGWTLSQKHAYLGNIIAHITPSAMKLEDKNNGVNLIALAPQWNVTLYSPERKLYYVMSYDTFARRGLRTTWVMLTNIQEWPVVGERKETYKNLDAMRMILPADPLARSKLARGISIDKKFGRAGDYWMCTTLGAAPQASAIIEQLYRFPRADGIPLAFKVYHGPHQRHFGISGDRFHHGDSTVLLETVKCTPESFPRSFFSVPSGLKKAKSDSEVAISPQTKSNLDEIVRDMGLGLDLGSGK